LKKYFLLILILFVNYSFSNNSNYNKNTLKARELIFDFKFNDAKLILEKENSPISYYLKSYSFFLQNILIGGEEKYNIYKKYFNDINDNLDKIDDNDSLKYLLKSEVYLQYSIVQLLNKDFISGSYHFVKSYNLYAESREKFTNLEQNKKLSGLFKIIAGITPEQGKKFIELIGLEGNINQGYKELNEYFLLVNTNKNLYVEAYTLNKLVFTFLKEDLGLDKFNLRLKEGYKNNSSVLFTDILQNYKFGNNDKLQINYNKLKEKNLIEIPLIYYYLGINSTLTNTNQSIVYLYKYLKITKSKHFIKSSYWQLARISILKDKKENYNKLKEFTLSLGENFTEADKLSEYEAKSDIIPNKYLLKARLYFDSNNFSQALVELNKINLEKFDDTQKAEYYYRLGRIQYKMRNYNNAKTNFTLVLKQYLKVEKYYIPYSALQIAYIFKIENNTEKQKEFYKLALKLNKFEYQNSIKHKSKSGLKNLE
jgi:predicted negative regulator of RcsB-dependent stress response